MRRKILLLILIVCSCYLFWVKSGLQTEYYFNKAKKLYVEGNYKGAYEVFEKVLEMDSENKDARYYYVISLSKLKPTFSIQKKIYDIANSDIDDKAKQEAKSQLYGIKIKLLKGVEDNYIHNAISGNEIIRWNIKSFPLKVYIENSNDIPTYYKENIQKALNQWTLRTNFISFSQTNNKEEAQIVINFKNYNSSDCSSTGCHYAVAYTTPEIGTNGILKKMNLTFYKTNPRKELFSNLEIYNSALHEIGHTLGIMGHSDNPEDVMYANNDKTNDIYSEYRSDSQYLTMNDIRTIALLYRIKPTITDKKSDSENLYYPPLILGNNNEILEKKLKEWENYINKYPNLSSGYINIASVYADMGKYDSALRYLDLAQTLENNSENLYTIEYNRAVIFYNQHDIKKALVYIQKAIAIKKTPEASELLQEIKKLLIH